MADIKTKMTRSGHACWKCGGHLWRLDPKVHGSEFYCDRCEMLTATMAQLDEAQANKGVGAIGVVAGVPCKIVIEEAK